MAIKFSPSFSQLLARQLQLSFSTTAGVSLHSGVKPTATELQANWANYNSTTSSMLWYATGHVFSMLDTNMVYASTVDPSATPLRNGVATWGILWMFTSGNIPFGSTSIGAHSNAGRFIVCDVSDLVGNGVIRLQNTTISVANGPMSIADIGFLTQ